jgi:hypothetical protein
MSSVLEEKFPLIRSSLGAVHEANGEANVDATSHATKKMVSLGIAADNRDEMEPATVGVTDRDLGGPDTKGSIK